MPRLISSQRYRNDGIIEHKRDICDYEVTVYPIDIDGEQYLVVLDGHHALDAALLDGVPPRFREPSGPARAELDFILETNGPEEWLVIKYIDDDYYFIDSGRTVW